MRFLGFGELTIKSWIEKVIDMEDYYTLLESIKRFKKATDLYSSYEEYYAEVDS